MVERSCLLFHELITRGCYNYFAVIQFGLLFSKLSYNPLQGAKKVFVFLFFSPYGSCLDSGGQKARPFCTGLLGYINDMHFLVKYYVFKCIKISFTVNFLAVLNISI